MLVLFITAIAGSVVLPVTEIWMAPWCVPALIASNASFSDVYVPVGVPADAVTLICALSFPANKTPAARSNNPE
jgi:hypothetical protein